MRLYRYETHSFDCKGKQPDSYLVIRKTPCYYVIDNWGKEKRVSREGGNKIFARETKEEALQDFFHRKRWELKHLKRRETRIKQALRRAGKPYEEVKVPLLMNLN